jgi:hypothetical protein
MALIMHGSCVDCTLRGAGGSRLTADGSRRVRAARVLQASVARRAHVTRNEASAAWRTSSASMTSVRIKLSVMMNPDVDVPGGLPAVYTALSQVARGLARAHGQRQFYALAQVQAEVGACGVGMALSAWAFAAFVTREDFEAFFAVRDTPGDYRALRAAMSPTGPRALSQARVFDDDFEIPVEALWWFFQEAAAR